MDCCSLRGLLGPLLCSAMNPNDVRTALRGMPRKQSEMPRPCPCGHPEPYEPSVFTNSDEQNTAPELPDIDARLVLAATSGMSPSNVSGAVLC